MIQIYPDWMSLQYSRCGHRLSCLGYDLRRVRGVMGTSCLRYMLSWIRFILITRYPGYELPRARVVLGPFFIFALELS